MLDDKYVRAIEDACIQAASGAKSKQPFGDRWAKIKLDRKGYVVIDVAGNPALYIEFVMYIRESRISSAAEPKRHGGGIITLFGILSKKGMDKVIQTIKEACKPGGEAAWHPLDFVAVMRRADGRVQVRFPYERQIDLRIIYTHVEGMVKKGEVHDLERGLRAFSFLPGRR